MRYKNSLAKRLFYDIASAIGNTLSIILHGRQNSIRLKSRSREMKAKSICCLFMVVITPFISHSTAYTSDYFTAAVYEHSPQGDFTTDTAIDIILSNLEYYDKATAVAKEQGADLILFPEYGVYFSPFNSDHLKIYYELIPNPKEVRVTPCDEANQYYTRPILFALSCMAKTNQIIVVANMGGREHCRGQTDCPEDGNYNYNANVAFDQNGTLIGRYYKEHLFKEIQMDLPKEKQDPVIETEFGKFAMFINFDIMFRKMTEVSQLTNIDAILFSSLWMNLSPFYNPIQWFQAWAIGNNATLLAANFQLPGFITTGSGIYLGREGSVVSVLNPDGIPKLAIATVPKRGRKISMKSKIIAITENETKEWNDNGKHLPSKCSHEISEELMNISNHCHDENVSNYTLQKLIGSEGHLKVCNEGMCCELDYAADSMNENFYLGVFNGTFPFFSRHFFSVENCFVARCDGINGTSCSHFVMHSKTVFHRISMKANFSTKYVYPSVILSGKGLLPVSKWTFSPKIRKASIDFNSSTGIRLLEATLMGRVYNKDPPYVRSTVHIAHD